MNMTLVFQVHVNPEEAIELLQDNDESAVMIPFTGHVTGPLFSGIIERGGVDTQIISANKKKHSLSARYMISGEDFSGEQGKLFIENNGFIHEPSPSYIFRTYPKVITNCHAIKHLEHDVLIAEGISVENGIRIDVYRLI